MSIRRRCEILDLNRSSYYLRPATAPARGLRLMRSIDEPYLETPSHGSRKMTAWLGRSGGLADRERVRRLMAVMGPEALHPRPRTTTAAGDARIDPYLLRDRELTHVSEVWSPGITDVPMHRGSMYSTAVIDRYSRYVPSWRLSNTLEGRSCPEAPDEALSPGRPEVFDTDQGGRLTSRAYTGRPEGPGVAVSMDGRGRALDNVFVERLWRSVKYEDICIKDYESVRVLERGLSATPPAEWSTIWGPPQFD